VTLRSDALEVRLLTLGSILQDVRLRACPTRPLTAGSPQLSAYDGGPLGYAGAVVGPVANRIGHARARLDSKVLHFEANAMGGHWLHSGPTGLHAKLWDLTACSETGVTFLTRADHGEGGLPGRRSFQARWDVTGAMVRLELTAQTDAPTLLALANHSYWTLDDRLDGCQLSIAAERYTLTDDTVLPTGGVAAVQGTRFDFRRPRPLTSDDVLDTNFCLADAPGPLRPAATLTGRDGLSVSVLTTAPGLQAFTADSFSSTTPSHHGPPYGPRFGLALEPQHWPDAPNQPQFPSIRVGPGMIWRQETLWQFTLPQ